MGQTSRGIVYPSNYSAVADIPADLQTMAQSIDDILYEDELNIQNNSDDIETIQTTVSEHEQTIQDNTTDINTLKNQVQSFALISETGNKVEIEINSLTYVMKIILKDKNNNVINTSNEIDLPLETMVVGARYDSSTKELVLTLKNGQETRFSIADLIDGLVSQSDFDDLAEIVETNTETIENNTSAIANNMKDIKQNEEDIDAITKLIDTEFDTNTAEGTTIDVDDSAEWDGIIGVGGNTEQKQLSGKNLFGVEALSGTFKGVTYSIEDSEILLNGTTEISGSIQKIAFKKTLPQGSYHIKQTQLSGSHVNEPTSNHCLSCVISDGSNNKYADKWLEALDTNFTLDESKQLYFVIYLLAGSSYTNFKFGIQIEEGSTATEYEQYCGGQESPNPDYPQEVKVVKGDNVVKHVGKNLFDSSFEEKTQYGVTLTYEDGIVTIDGKSSNQGLLELKNNLINKLKKGNYTVIFKYISGTKEGGAIRISIGNSRMQTLVEDSNRHFSFVISNSSQNIVQSKSFDEDREINKWGVYINTNITFTNYKFRLYVVEGTYTSNTIPTYEPYREENYRFDLGGKNIFNKDVEKKNSYPSTGIGSVVNYTNSSATDTYVNCCFLEKGKTYTFSWKQDETPASTNKRIGCLVDDNNVILSTFDTWESSINHRTITPSVSGYLILPVDKNATDIQIEEGTVATEYSRYMPNPIELCKIEDNNGNVVAQDRIIYENGNFQVEKNVTKFINNGTGQSNFKLVTSYIAENLLACVFNLDHKKLGSVIAIICDKMTGKYLKPDGDRTDSNNVRNAEGIALHNDNTNQIVCSVKKSRLQEESIGGIAQFFAENPLTMYVPALETTYEPITDPTLISQLEALLKVQMYHGVNHFYVETDNLEPVMELTYKQSNKIKNEKQNARLDNIESRLALLE